MTNSQLRGRVRAIARSAGVPLALALVCGIVCRFAAGDQLGLYLGGLFAMTLTAPAVTAGEETWKGRAMALAATAAGISAVWLVSVFGGSVTFAGWASSALVLIAYGAAIAGLAIALRTIGVGPVAAGAVATILGLAWLSWPVWLCPWLNGPDRDGIANALVAGHPGMAINGALRQTYGAWWGHHKLAYQLANRLNDIPYELPQSVWVCVLIHLALAGVFIAAASLIERMRRLPTTPPAHRPAGQ